MTKAELNESIEHLIYRCSKVFVAESLDECRSLAQGVIAELHDIHDNITEGSCCSHHYRSGGECD